MTNSSQEQSRTIRQRATRCRDGNLRLAKQDPRTTRVPAHSVHAMPSSAACRLHTSRLARQISALDRAARSSRSSSSRLEQAQQGAQSTDAIRPFLDDGCTIYKLDRATLVTVHWQLVTGQCPVPSASQSAHNNNSGTAAADDAYEIAISRASGHGHKT